MNISLRLAERQEQLYLELDKDSPMEVVEAEATEAEATEAESETTETETEANEVADKKIFECEYCDFTSNLANTFKNHQNSVRTCPTCSKVFCGYRSKQNFTSHVKKHIVKPKPKCVHCGKEYEFKHLVKKHMLWSKCGRQ